MQYKIVKLPTLFKNILILTIGISGGALIYNNGDFISYTYGFVLFVSGLFSALALYGFVSIIADIRNSRDCKDFCNRIIKNLEIAFYDSNR
tara:strand:+ start:532 stop:804 length:273 start_codon:yes stop_codon:yes gene_type:complete